MSFPSPSSTRKRGCRLTAAVLACSLTVGVTTTTPALADSSSSLGSSGSVSGSGAVSGSVSVVDDLVAAAKQQVYNITDSEFVRTPLAHSILRHIDTAPVVILGAQLQEDCSAPQVLTDRLHAAATLLAEHPENPVIVTGGQTREDCPSEAAVMKDALTDMGVDNEIILEEEAGNTLQNVKYTAETITERGGTAIVVTSDPHYLRALKNYRDAGLRAFGYVGGRG
ncbi:YdcF family protein [Corynebacterium glyciniphilum]|uniref:YdcF family protein n=1 Tax=Corynebacterium glyciniphilum TaxID=1404244 RepID=UPI003DA13FDF